MQNKLHFAIHGHTAAELIYERVDAKTVAKNYLSKDKLDSLGRIVNAFLELAESRTKRNIPMTMRASLPKSLLVMRG